MEELLKHFSTGLSDGLKQYATDTALRKSRYLFTTRRGSKQTAYCTHCHETSTVKHFWHNDREECPNCKSLCTVKASGRGRQAMIDRVYFVYYEKSVVNPQAIVARGIYTVRDYSESYFGVETKYAVKAWYVFEPGGGSMGKRYASYWNGAMHECNPERCKTVHSLFAHESERQNYWGRKGKKFPDSVSDDSIAEAIEGTPFQYCSWGAINGEDMVKFFALFAKYPKIEYLIKCGFDDIVYAKITGGKTCGAINWRGATLQKMLKLNKKDIRDIRNIIQKINIYEQTMYVKLYQINKADKSNLSPDDISDIIKNHGPYFEDVQRILKHTTLRRFVAYVTRQLAKGDREKHHFSPAGVLMSWRDYLNDCEALAMDLSSEHVLFPANLYQAHQNTIKQRKIVGSIVTTRKIASRLNSLQKYCFASSGITIRPAESSQELIDEGKALVHCVGTYADKYANGEIVILLLRKAESPEKPFYTMELRKDHVSQCRGEKNCQMTEDVLKFVEAFKVHRLNKSEPVQIAV